MEQEKHCERCNKLLTERDNDFNGYCKECYNELNEYSKQEHCNKCGKVLAENDNQFMGYCEECYNILNEYPKALYLVCFLVPILAFIGGLIHLDKNNILARRLTNIGIAGSIVLVLIVMFYNM